MEIRNVDKSETELIDQIVQIHLETFQGFFLSFMGAGFLKQMYLSYCEHDASSLAVALDERGKSVGFVAFSTEQSDLYKHMIKRHLIAFGWYSLGAFFRKPQVFMRLVRAFLKPSETVRDEQYVELSSIGVSPECKSRGIGSQLIDYVKQQTDFSRYAYVSLETDALNNEAANHFYVKNGFELKRTYTTHEGRRMNEYRYRR